MEKILKTVKSPLKIFYTFLFVRFYKKEKKKSRIKTKTMYKKIISYLIDAADFKKENKKYCQ